MAIRRFQISIEGTSGLLLSNNAPSDPLSEAAKIKKHFTSKRTKADQDHQNLRVIDWVYSGYWKVPGKVHIDDTENAVTFEGFAGLYMPSQNFQRCLRNGATAFKLGKEVERALIVENEADIQYNIDGLLQGEHKIDNLKTRIEILTAKNNSLQKKFDHRNAIVKNIEENQRREELARLEAEDLNDRLRTENIELKTKVNNLEIRVQNTIEKKNFESIMTEKEKLLEDLTSTRAAMLSYKKMTEVIAE